MNEMAHRTLCDACSPPAVELVPVVVVAGRCANCGVTGASPELTVFKVEQKPPPHSPSSAPLVSLLRILELCWRERHMLSADLVERLREQLEGPLGTKAKADERVLQAMGAVSEWDLRNGHWRHEPAGVAELARRGLKPRRSSPCLYQQARSELGTAVELAAAVQRCGERDLGKHGIDETCPWCVEAVRAVMLRVTPTQAPIVERWMHLPAREQQD